MSMRQVTLSARYGEPRIDYRDIDADDDATAAEIALRQVGERDWLVGWVSEIKNAGPVSEMAERMERKAGHPRDLFGGM